MLRVLLTLGIASVAVACGSGESTMESAFWDTEDDVRGSPGLGIYVTRELEGILELSDGVAIVRVEAVSDVRVAGPLSEPVSVDKEAREDFERFAAAAASAPTNSTYTAEVKEWIKGGGEKGIRLHGLGGLAADGTPHFIDGYFLLEPGRTCLLGLTKDDGGEYHYGSARSAFDLTDGVKVLNNPDTRDLEHYEEMSVDEFVEHISSLVSG